MKHNKTKKVYLTVPSAVPKEHKECLQALINYFKKDPKYNLVLDLNWLTSEKKNKDFYKTETHGLDESDYLIAEISYPSIGVGYLIAYGVLKKKKILCLYRDSIHKSTSSLLDSVPKSKLTIKQYNPETLNDVLSSYFSSVKPFQLYKFNFVVDQELKDYIDWLSLNKESSTSDQLRTKIVEKIINEDEEYQEYLEKNS